MKTLGVIGGMGPEATSYFYDEVIRHTYALTDQEHINMVILNHATMPDRTHAIKTGDDKSLIDAMKSDLEKLKACGAENIAIPCNTSHFFYDKIQAMTDIPVINMITETAREAASEIKMMGKKTYDVTSGLDGSSALAAFSAEAQLEKMKDDPSIGRVGIMATDGTICSGVYKKALEAEGLVPVEPDPDVQKEVMSLIYDDIKAGKMGDEDKFHHALKNLREKGADVVILACTEISVYKRHHNIPHYCLDAMDILVREAVIRSGADYEE